MHEQGEGKDAVGAVLVVLFAGVTAAGMAYLGHLVGLAHFHLLGAVPIGAVLLGAGSATGVALAIRLSRSYDTAGFRIFAQVGGLATYFAVLVLDFITHQPRVVSTMFVSPEVTQVLVYVRQLVTNGAAGIAAQLPSWIHIPPQLGFWLGTLRLLVEVLGAVVATGWTISLLAGVPFCWQNHRFYELRHLVDSANLVAVREWETAIQQRRPIEARAILARVKAGKVQRQDKAWMRIAVHQCPVCQAARVRIEKRRRAVGFTRTEPTEEMTFEPAHGATLLAS